MPAFELIRNRRAKLKFSMRKLARLVGRYLPGIDDSDISKIERGLRKVQADEVPVFAWALHCRREELLDPEIEDPWPP